MPVQLKPLGKVMRGNADKTGRKAALGHESHGRVMGERPAQPRRRHVFRQVEIVRPRRPCRTGNQFDARERQGVHQDILAARHCLDSAAVISIELYGPGAIEALEPVLVPVSDDDLVVTGRAEHLGDGCADPPPAPMINIFMAIAFL